LLWISFVFEISFKHLFNWNVLNLFGKHQDGI